MDQITLNEQQSRTIYAYINNYEIFEVQENVDLLQEYFLSSAGFLRLEAKDIEEVCLTLKNISRLYRVITTKPDFERQLHREKLRGANQLKAYASQKDPDQITLTGHQAAIVSSLRANYKLLKVEEDVELLFRHFIFWAEKKGLPIADILMAYDTLNSLNEVYRVLVAKPAIEAQMNCETQLDAGNAITEQNAD